MAISEEFIAALHNSLLEYYRLNGMDRSLRLNGVEEPFHHSQCTCPKCLEQAHRNQPALYSAVRAEKKKAQGEVAATVVVNTTPPVAVRPVPNPYGRLKVNVLASRRIGDEERNKVLDHLQDMFVRGHLTQAELDARQQAALAAKVAAELEFLTRDLPFARITREPEPEPERFPFGAAMAIMAALMGMLSISLVIAAGMAALPAAALVVMAAMLLVLIVIRRN